MSAAAPDAPSNPPAAAPAPVNPPTRGEREADRRKTYAGLRMSAVGMELGLSVVVGYGLGWFVDTKAGTGPWGGIVGIALGFTAGIRSILRTVKLAERAEAAAEEAGQRAKQQAADERRFDR